jgi:SAM-dependent methyltransferase
MWTGSSYGDPGRLGTPRLPLSSRYGEAWQLRYVTGPNALWTTELLAEALPLRPGVRVLDLGCGAGVSSAFLAREYGVRVWAVDSRLDPAAVSEVARDAGVADRITPVVADARRLPFRAGSFDAVVCLSSFMWFGADDGVLASLVDLLVPGGRLGAVMSGRGSGGSLAGRRGYYYWNGERRPERPLDWWAGLLRDFPGLVLETAEMVPGSGRLWLHWNEAYLAAAADPLPGFDQETELLRADRDGTWGWLRLVARAVPGTDRLTVEGGERHEEAGRGERPAAGGTAADEHPDRA